MGRIRVARVRLRDRGGPVAEGFDEGGGAVAEPAVELGLVLELLTAGARDHEVAGVDFREGGEVAPEFLELGGGEDVLLTVAPAFLDVLEGDVGGEAGGEVADGVGDPGGGVFGRGGGGVFGGGAEEVLAGESEGGEEGIEADPGGHGVVVAEAELVLLAGHGESLDEAGETIDAGESATAILEAAMNHLEGQAASMGAVPAEEGGVGIGADGVDVMEEQVLDGGLGAEQAGEDAIAEEVGDFEEMTDGMEALGGEIVGVVGRFAGGLRPVDEGVAEAFADLLLLFVEELLGHLLPLEAEIAFGGDEAKSHGAAPGEEDLG